MKKTLLEKALQVRFRDIGDRLGELSWKDKKALLVEHLEWLEEWEEEILFLPFVCQPQNRKEEDIANSLYNWIESKWINEKWTWLW